MALALSEYEALKSLDDSADFYEREKNFDQVWTDLGGQVPEKSLGGAVADEPRLKEAQGRVVYAISVDFNVWANLVNLKITPI